MWKYTWDKKSRDSRSDPQRISINQFMVIAKRKVNPRFV